MALRKNPERIKDRMIKELFLAYIPVIMNIIDKMVAAIRMFNGLIFLVKKPASNLPGIDATQKKDMTWPAKTLGNDLSSLRNVGIHAARPISE